MTSIFNNIHKVIKRVLEANMLDGIVFMAENQEEEKEEESNVLKI